MRAHHCRLTGVLVGLSVLAASAATRYVNIANPTPAAPYTSWAIAATNIQDAVDAAADGDLILVTNGVYATGATAVYGMSNRVAVTKPVTVQSVNGPQVTLIRGFGPNGANAVRCVYLTNGAVLAGFTLTNGATQASGDSDLNQSGGGVWCESTNATVTNCVLTDNSAQRYGGGAYSGTLNNCTLTANSAAAYGGGGYIGTLNNCVLTGNSALKGGGACSSMLNNCTLTDNSVALDGSGAYYSTMNNCIAYYNRAGLGGDNYSASTLNYCCTTPLPWVGVGNIDAEPQLASSWHLSVASPCRRTGSAVYATGMDLDGEPWADPPSIGCDEYWSGAVTGALSVAIMASQTNVAIGSTVGFQALIGGRASASRWDLGGGMIISNRPYASRAWFAPGSNMVELRAYNESYPAGVAASVIVNVTQAIHYVSPSSLTPMPPYNSWATAATNIQDAVNAAADRDLILVTNGVYATGVTAVYGMSNRVAVTKPVTVQSVNGPAVTLIEGLGPNGSNAVRCVYLTNGAVLAGFTLTNGATQASGDYAKNRSGGGVWCESTNAVVTNCVVTGNRASIDGGGACSGTLSHCTLMNNSAGRAGGGAHRGALNRCTLTANSAGEAGGASYSSTLDNCTLTRNSAHDEGGGSCGGMLNNCMLTGNSARTGGGSSHGTLNNCTFTGNSALYGGGVYSSVLNNCIVYYNTAHLRGNNYDGSAVNYCCTSPLPSSGLGNIDAEPQLASDSHLSVGSPCRGAGSAAHASGSDFDGEPWANPPSIGCDEYWTGSVTGSLTAGIVAAYTNVAAGVAVHFHALIRGRVSGSRWDFGDGVVVSNQPYASHAWSIPGNYVVELRAYNESNPDGVTATVTVQVVVPPVYYVSASSLTPTAPYNSWPTAATTIQDAVDAAVPGALVLVSNGVYATGATAVYGMSNRVAVTKPLTVQSVHGPAVTTIGGYQVPGVTNGPEAVRCVYLTNGAVLAGFTLTNGATQLGTTQIFGDWEPTASGGGIWCESTNAVVTNCVLTGNSAAKYGAAAYLGTLNNCTVKGNSAQWHDGGGACYAILNDCRLTGNSASQGGGAYFCTLNDCTLTGNEARYAGGGAYSSVLNNCTLTSNRAGSAGGGIYSGTLNNCTLTGNSAPTGGGASGGTLNSCALTGNWATNGGGTYFSTLNNCAITGNAAVNYGGGAYEGTLKNCAITGNSAANYGGGACEGTLTNCTLTGNSAQYGGGVYNNTLYNCIVYYNKAVRSGDNHLGSVLNYSCSTPQIVYGGGSIVTEPRMGSASHISASSPCRGAGSPAHASGVDLDGEPWANPPSMGCDEYWSGSVTGTLSAAIVAAYTNVAPGVAVDFQAVIGGRVNASRWDFGDGLTVDNRPYVSHAWLTAGTYVVALRAYNETNPDGVVARVTVQVIAPPLHYVSADSPAPTPPYSSWATAATTIQDAVDATTVPGALVLVSNGVYRTGATAVYGMSNRVAVTKPVTVQGVNGPAVTLIEGFGPNGAEAIRCVYLTNGAVLSGFTLTNGATQTSGDSNLHRSGGGVWSESTNTVVTNCVLTGNSAARYGGGVAWATVANCTVTGNSAYYGGGAWSSRLTNCVLTENTANNGGGTYDCTLNKCTLTGNFADYGGGAYGGILNNSALMGNSAQVQGGGAHSSTLNNCTVTENATSGEGGGTYSATLTNSIVYYNTSRSGGHNYLLSTLNYCCTTPHPGGVGNIDAEPQLAGNWHLNAASPCRGAGSAAYVSGLDLDGEPWGNPPSIGCDEYRSGSLTGALSAAIVVTYTNVATSFAVDFQAVIEGRASASRWDFGDGTIVSNRLYASHAWLEPGSYTVELRVYNESNPNGLTASVTVHVVQEVRYASSSSVTPLPPYDSWATAATNIQDALDAALPGALVLVSNGVYRTGAKAVYGMSNRVAVTKPVTVRSVNGPAVTIIEGFKSNSADAVRCVYLTNGAVLAGFTLTNGASQPTGDWEKHQSGGGVWCESTNAVLTDCLLIGNLAYQRGGGAYLGTLKNCAVTGNLAFVGGGAYSATLENCTLTGNSADNSGGGAYFGTLNNCTLTSNRARSNGGGVYSGTLNNCTLTGNSAAYGGGSHSATLTNSIVYYNWATSRGGNYEGGTLQYCCTTPLPGGVGNIANAPLFVDTNGWIDLRLQSDSPCINAGDNASVVGATDLNGNSRIFGGLVDIGAYESTVTILIAAEPADQTVAVGGTVTFSVTARGAALIYHWRRDGAPIAGVNFATFTLTNAQLADSGSQFSCLVSNAYGTALSSSAILTVVGESVHYVALDSTNPQPPYLSWATAATNIQDAVEAAIPGALVLVSNGVYATGATAVYGMSNRVAVTKPLTVQSVNGPEVTRIAGYQMPGVTNGANAVRCVYLTNGAVLAGFTLTNGATQTADDISRNQSGGGVWCESLSAVISNCVLAGNSARYDGGGAFRGTLNNCTLTGNLALWSGGGACSSTLNNCTLTGNFARYYGGGACAATQNDCALTGNSAQHNGGGAYSGMLNRCMLTGNSAVNHGGGAHSSTLNNCTLTGNSASLSGGGARASALRNCTLAGNSAGEQGGGTYLGTLDNCIAYYNTAASNANFYSGTLRYCCTLPLPSGVGNRTNAPLFVDANGWANLRLQSNSPCINAGLNDYAPGLTDLDGRPRIVGGVVDIGAYESAAVISFPVEPFDQTVVAGWPVSFTVSANGALPLHYQWQSNGVMIAGATNSALTLTNAQVADSGTRFSCLVSNTYGTVLSSSALLTVLLAPMHYAWVDSPNPQPPYLSWATAATNIQDAVDVAIPGSLVLVSNGLYAAGARAVYGMSNRLAVTKPVTVRSVNGPAVTFIHGSGPNGSTAVRCVYLTNGAVLAGFTLTNGATQTAGDAGRNQSGGGVWCESANVAISNCVLAGNSASLRGGGSYSGTLNNCALAGNSAGEYAGGAYYSTLNNCTVVGNSSSYRGGATYSGTLNNCTLAGNSAVSAGGGAYYGTLNNCIVYYNTSPSSPEYFNSAFRFCCTTPLPSGGVANFTNAPLLVYTNGWSDLRLQSNSPCINAGNNAYVVGFTDLDGNPRISGGTVDIGAYEYQGPGSAISYAWLLQHGLLTDGSADHADGDADGLNNWQEWVTGTDPTNAASVFRIDLLPGPQSVLMVPTSLARRYTLFSCPDLSAPVWTPVPGQVALPGTGGPIALVDPTGTIPRFYRVSVSFP